MITIYDSADMWRVLSSTIEPDLKIILLARLDLLAEFLSDWDLGDLAHFIVVEPDDSMETIEVEMGISPFENLVNGVRYPDPAFEPSWEFCVARQGYFDVTFALSDSGLGLVLLVPDRDGVLPGLQEMLRTYSCPP